MRTIVNPFKQQEETNQLATASAVAIGEQEVATASALSNIDPSMCPKCGGKMTTAFLFDRRPVYYCGIDRVSHPQA